MSRSVDEWMMLGLAILAIVAVSAVLIHNLVTWRLTAPRDEQTVRAILTLTCMFGLGCLAVAAMML